MDQRRLRAVLWDFDGAVVDSELMWSEYEKDELARHGASWSDEQLKDRIGEPAIVTAQRISESCSGAITLAQAYEDSVPGTEAVSSMGTAVLAVPLRDCPGARPRRLLREGSLEGLDVECLEEDLEEPVVNLSGVRTGPLVVGERVTLTDPKGRRKSVVLREGAVWHTTKGAVKHDDLIGGPDGVTVRSAGGTEYLALRPLLNEFMVAMPREAAVVYPKDAAQIVMWADIFPGARVLEAGVGSGALSLALLRAIGPLGKLYSYERRQQFADVARKNVENFIDGEHPAWKLTVGDLVEVIADEPIDRAILDMLAPWECVDAVGERLIPGGVLCCYVATTTQLGRVMDTFRAHGGFTEPTATETTVRDWHAEGLAIRPGHGTSAHTGFLVISRRLAPGVSAPIRKRRPAPGAYGPDYQGPRPLNMPESN